MTMSLNSSERAKARSVAYMVKKGLARVNGRIVSATEATKASARAPIAKAAPAASAKPAPRAMTDAEAVTHHRRQGVAAVQSGAAAMGVSAVIATTTSHGAAASAATPAKPATLSQEEIDAGWRKAVARVNGEVESEPTGPWAAAIAKMNARLNGGNNHGHK